MTNGHEVELKLELDPADAGALRSHRLLAGATPSTRAQSSTYFDTSKQALRKAGYTLRVRTAGGSHVQTVKQTGGGAGLFDRPEWEAPVPGPRPDAHALAATPLAALLPPRRLAKLVPLVTSTIDRTVWNLDHRDSAIELVLDIGTVGGGGDERPVSEVELELKRGRPEALLDLALRLAEHVPLRLGVLSKAERGFALAEGRLDKVSKAGNLDLRETMDVAEGFTAIVHACLRHFRLNEAFVAQRREPEALHQARVAMRRLRSAFSLFRPAIADDEYERLREELRWFTGTLGDARNLDVFLERRDDSLGLARAALVAARERAYDDAIEALDSRRLRTLMIALVAWTEAGDWRRRRRARAPLADFARARLDRLWRKLSQGGGDLAALEEEERHRLRIEIKKLRYAVEFLAGLYGSASLPRKRFAAALEEMQESLGRLNDIATERTLIARLGLAADNVATAQADPEEEARHIAEAQLHFAELMRIGPLWV